MQKGKRRNDDESVMQELKSAWNEPTEEAMDEKPFLMLPRGGGPRSRAIEVAGGGMAGLKKTGRRSPEGIPYADLGTVNISARRKRR